MEKANALIEYLCTFEITSKQEEQEFIENLYQNETLGLKSIPGKLKAPIYRHVDVQMKVQSQKVMIKFKRLLSQVLLSFANPDVNGYANNVVEMLNRGLVNSPENNITNQLLESMEGDHLSEGLVNLDENVEESEQHSSELAFQPLVKRSNQSQLQLSTHSKNTSKIRKKKLPSNKLSVDLRNSTKRPVMSNKASDNNKNNKATKQDSTNAVPFPVANISDHNLNQQLSQSNGGALSKVTHQQAKIERKVMWKMLPQRASLCLVKGCDGGRSIANKHRPNRELYHNKWYHVYDRNCYCSICSKGFSTFGKLEEHYLTVHHYEYQCASPNCSFMSKTRAQFKNHYQQFHPFSDLVNNSNGYSAKSPADESYFRIVYLRCRVCSEKFNTRTEYYQHMTKWPKYCKPYECAVKGCSSSFLSGYHLQDHYLYSHHARKKQLRCSCCFRNFEGVSHLIEHLNKDKYYVETGQFACVSPECGFTAEFRSLVIEHYVESHQ